MSGLFTILLSAAHLWAAPQPAIGVLLDGTAGFSLSPAPAANPPLITRLAQPGPGLAGEELFRYLHEATAPDAKAAFSYDASRAYMYSTADNTGCGGYPGIMTFYSRVCVRGSSSSGSDYREAGDLNRDGSAGDFVNAEHIWPQGYFDRRLPMVADLHHLAPTFSVPNGRRGSYRFSKVYGPVYSTSSGSRQGGDAFEPADEVKGNVARAMFYFMVRYHDRSIRQGMNYQTFWVDAVPLLLEWNRQDPPDEAERRRNDLVEQYQGNRNPFIDDYSLADRIGAAVLRSH